MNYVPAIDKLYVPFGPYHDCEKVLQAEFFFPVLLTGPSGVGKTFCVEQLCAQHNREFFRVNITYQSDEDSLIGGFRLNNGSTYFDKGPVLMAMERGAVLLLDEIDLASPMLIMCLQSILEGKGYLIKKTGEWVHPKPGFQIFATANTKGQGDDSGSFIGTQILNEAFLERFPLTFDNDYPPVDVESDILTKLGDSLGIKKPEFVSRLLKFAELIRQSYTAGDIDHTLSTRRLAHIMRIFSIWGDERQAVTHALNRFDKHTLTAFMDIYDSIRSEGEEEDNEGEEEDNSELDYSQYIKEENFKPF